MINFLVDQKVLDLGVKVKTALITGVRNSPNPDVDNFIAEELKKISVPNIDNDLFLQGFRELHEKVGRSNRDYVSSPESLINFFTKKGRLPNISPVVNLYNLISLKSHLALGAHDTSKTNGNVTLKITDGSENFIPLGKTEKENIFPGEYAYVDEQNNVICRLEVIQCDATKITTETKDVFLITQGNAGTDQNYIDKTARETCELITKFCGGTYQLLN
jgi:DNA/RNA-binding domain of Phe-tRNA-synthetase-like protein